MLLAAAAVPARPDDALTPLLVLIGFNVLLQVLGMGAAAVKWLGGRAVASEDRDKEALKSELKGMASELKTMASRFDEMKAWVDSRIERQAEHYRGQTKELQLAMDKKLEDFEYRLRQDTTRAIHDSQAFRKP